MRSRTFIAVAAVLALLAVGAAGVYAYDRAHADTVADGITVGGVDVGGLTRDEARRKLQTELLQPLRSPVVVKARGREFHLTAREARIAANIDEIVDQAVDRGRQSDILTRTLRSVTGGRVDARLQPKVTHSRAAVTRLVSRVRRAVDRPAQDASVRFRAAGLEQVASHTGLRLARANLRRRVDAAILRPGENQRLVRASVRRIVPKVTTKDLRTKYQTALIVDRGAHALRLYKDLKLAKTYSIAVGMQGLETPAGLYDIENKQTNPSWHVPESDWAGALAGRVIPPGPTNPIKARWLGIIGGAGIHGTTDDASIGSNASHGCIRMHIPDVIDLYDRVPVGAPVYIA